MRFNISNKDKYYLAVDIGGTNTKFALIDKHESVAHKFRIPTNSDSFESLVSDIKNSLGPHLKEIISIGIGAPDVAANKLEIVNATNLGFKDAKVVEVFKKEFGVPIILENDASTAAIGEKSLGVAKGLSDFIVLTLGTGVGSGVYLNGRPYQGAHNAGCELGHMTLIAGGRKCGCGLKGHVETYLSCPGVCKTHKELHAEKIGFTDFAANYLSGEAKTKKTVEQVAKQMAGFLGSLNAAFAPQAIILAGGGAVLGENYLKQIKKEYALLEYPNHRGMTEICLTEFTPEYGAIMGAYALIKEGKKKPPI